MGLCHLLVAGEKLVYVGAQAPVLDDLLECEVADLAGATLVPGFIDEHARQTTLYHD